MPESENNTSEIFIPHNFSHKSYALRSTLIIIILYISAGIILSMIKIFLFTDESGKCFEIYSQGLSQILFLLLPTIYFARRALLPFRVLIRISKPPNLFQILASVIGIVAFQAFANGYIILQEHLIPDFLFTYYKELEETINNMYINLLGGESVLNLLRALFIGALIPALCEETLFRGFLQRSLEEHYKAIKAILFTSIIFALIHLNPIGFIPLLIIGVYLGFLAYSTNNLILPLIVHFINNAFAVFVIYSPHLSGIESQTTKLPPSIGIILMLSGLIILLTSSYLIYIESEKQKQIKTLQQSED
jgi:uncharacterized protein